MAINLNDLKQRVASFHKKAADLNPTDPTEKGTVSAPKDAVKDPKITNPSNAKAPQAVAGIETMPAVSDANAKSPKNGNAEEGQTKSATGVENAIAKLKNLSKKAKSNEASAQAPAPVESQKEVPINMGPDALYKLASAIFETQEGIDTVLPLLRKKAGQEAAISLLKQASDEYDTQVAEYNYMQKVAYESAQAQANFDLVVSEIVKSASSKEEADRLIKTASQHIKNREFLGSELLKAAYDQSIEDAGEMVGAEEAGGEAELAGAQGEPTIEQILMLLEQAVASGEIQEDEAIQIAQALVADDQGGGEAPVEEVPAEVPAEGEMPKEASANIKNILKHLNR